MGGNWGQGMGANRQIPPPRTRCARAAPPPSRGRGKKQRDHAFSPSLLVGEGVRGWGVIGVRGWGCFPRLFAFRAILPGGTGSSQVERYARLIHPPTVRGQV